MLLELTLLLLLAWLGLFTVQVSRALSDEAPRAAPAGGHVV